MALRLLLAVIAFFSSAPAPQEPNSPPKGTIRLIGHAVADERGEFAALGASLFWAAWGYKHDRARLDEHLALLAKHRFDYIRALGVVGRQPYWAGREIDWRWPDYDAVIAGLTDHAYDTYGLRVEWTIFGDAEQMIPRREDRFMLVDRFLKMTKGREHKIMHFEIANESWQNGFHEAEGIAQIRELTRYLADRTEVPVAISDSEGHECAHHEALYAGAGADILTEHFARDISSPLGRWAPVVAPWPLRGCKGLPAVVSSNEPIGPKSSVESEDDPMRLVAAAVVAYLSGVGLYVLHTDAGIWGREPLTSMPNAAAILQTFRNMKGYLPGDIANWAHYRHDAPEHPFVTYAGDRRDAVRTDATGDGPVEVFASIKDRRFFAAAVGVINGLTLEARRQLVVDVIHPLTGETLEHRELRGGEKITPRALPLVILTGTFAD